MTSATPVSQDQQTSTPSPFQPIKDAFHTVEGWIGNVNHKVEQLAYDHLPKKVADVALTILRALPAAIVYTCVSLLAPPGLGGLALKLVVVIPIALLADKHSNSKVKAAGYYGLAMGHGAVAVAKLIAITQDYFGLFEAAVSFGMGAYLAYKGHPAQQSQKETILKEATV